MNRTALRFLVLALWFCLQAVHAQEKATFYEESFRRDSGWTGADGTYSIPLSVERTLWGFSDTFWGEVEHGIRRHPYRFVNNSLVEQRGNSFHFYEAPVFEPPDKSGWFWLFDGIARGDEEVEILLGQFQTDGSGGAFGFEQSGLWWASFRVPDDGESISVTEYRPLPFFWADKAELVTFGSAIVDVDEWLYVYGIHQEGLTRSAVVARVPREKLGEASEWRFFDGSGWSSNPRSVQPLFSDASVEYSVHRALSGEFIYVACDNNGMSDRIVARSAPEPEGPWQEPTEIAKLPEHKGDIFCYNAKAHPERSRDGKILLSYNVNSTDLPKVELEADIYRPRFLWWKPERSDWFPIQSPHISRGMRP